MTDTRPLKERLEEEKAQIDIIADQREQMLASAELRARVALHQGSTHENIRNWKAADKALKEYREEKAAENSGERFKNIEQAAAWIISQGYIVSPRSVRNHADRTGFPKKQKDGSYLKSEIATYSVANWENPGRTEIAPASTPGRDELMQEQVRKLKLANDTSEGLYVLKSEAERRAAAAAAFLKNDLANFGPHSVDKFIDLISTYLQTAGVNTADLNLQTIIPDLLGEYDRSLEEWLGHYAKKGTFDEP